jgi:phosphoesterase RecJ-like protein
MMRIEEAIKNTVTFFKNNDYFTIICHVNPDGDTLGSGYALCGALHIMGKHARVVCGDKPSSRFDFLKEAVDPALMDFPPNTALTLVTVDVADIELLGSLKEGYSKKVDFCIDHHVSNKNYAAETLLDTEAAACAEVVWALIKELFVDYESELKSAPTGFAVAAAIYTGISTDTGCFRYSNTTAQTLMIAAELMRFDFEITKINYLMFEMKTRERIALEQKAYSTMEYYFGNTCAIVTLTADMLRDVDPEDASNISILPKQVEGVEVGVIIKEKDDDKWKVSLRTSTNINAQAICGELGGGGHIRAAGCTLQGSLDLIKKTILNKIEQQIEEEF